VSVQWLLLTGMGLGRLRPGPGTWGSLPPPVLALALVALLGGDGLTSTDRWIVSGAVIALGVVFGVACVVLGGWAERHWGRKDPGDVVADEIAGQALVVIGLPWRSFGEPGGTAWNATLAATAFAAFRVFDITKPPPANQLQRIPGGWGILIDDLVAGVYALIVTQLMVRLVWAGVL
jgi:phosphatidylglycerophosphatase A